MDRSVTSIVGLCIALLWASAPASLFPTPIQVHNIVGPWDERGQIRELAPLLGWTAEEIDFAFRAVGYVECPTAAGAARNSWATVGSAGTMTTVASAFFERLGCTVHRHAGPSQSLALQYPSSGSTAVGTDQPRTDIDRNFAVLRLPLGLGNAAAYPVDPTGNLAAAGGALYLLSAVANDWDTGEPILQHCRLLRINPAAGGAGATADVSCDTRGMMAGSVLLTRDASGTLVAVGILAGFPGADLDNVPASVESGSFARVILYQDRLYDALRSLGGKGIATGLDRPFVGINPSPAAGAAAVIADVPIYFNGVVFQPAWIVHFELECDEWAVGTDLARAIDRLEYTLAKYPPDFLHRAVNNVSVCRYLQINDASYGGTWDRQVLKVYIATDEMTAFELDELERTFHHELSTGILNDLGFDFPFDEWEAATGGYAYDGVGVGYTIGQGVEVGLVVQREFLERGFILPYGVNNLEEDFNTFAEMAMTYPAEFRGYAEGYPLICLKAKIIGAFYESAGIPFLSDLGSLDCAATPLTTDMIRELQTILTAAGYDTGGIDGVVGPRTRAAIAAAQTRLGLPAGPATYGLLLSTRAEFAAPPTPQVKA